MRHPMHVRNVTLMNQVVTGNILTSGCATLLKENLHTKLGVIVGNVEEDRRGDSDNSNSRRYNALH